MGIRSAAVFPDMRFSGVIGSLASEASAEFVAILAALVRQLALGSLRQCQN
jgi:hypothetical protein